MTEPAPVNARWLARCVSASMVLATVVSCGGGPKDASSIIYEVSFADVSAGEADVSFTESDGTVVAMRVTIPWSSDPVGVRDGQSYLLDATAPDTGKNLSCDIRLDTGWTVGSSMRGGRCSYTFPDELDD